MKLSESLKPDEEVNERAGRVKISSLCGRERRRWRRGEGGRETGGMGKEREAERTNQAHQQPNRRRYRSK